jgi:hypothetical protein
MNNLHNTHVWAGIIKDGLTRQHVLPSRLIRASYHLGRGEVVNVLPELMEDKPFEHDITRFMHDGDLAHFLSNLIKHLNQVFAEK